MKKLIGLSLFCMGMFFSSLQLFAQESLPGDDENPYGGVCCQQEDAECNHPIGLKFADSSWRGGASAF